jgi:hypothetical protein
MHDRGSGPSVAFAAAGGLRSRTTHSLPPPDIRAWCGIYTIMTHSAPTIIYEPSEAGAPYVAAAFSPDGEVLASRPFPTREAAEAFLQAFMQENAGEYGLMHERSVPPVPEGLSAGGELQERRAGVIKSARDENKRRRLGVYGDETE